MFVVEPDPDSPADVIGDEPVWHTASGGEDEARVVGWITSGGYAHYCGVSLAWGYVPTELAEHGTTGFEIEIIGKRRPARLQPEPVLDPTGSRMRS
jgi:dimethylglycine dehydrogenase